MRFPQRLEEGIGLPGTSLSSLGQVQSSSLEYLQPAIQQRANDHQQLTSQQIAKAISKQQKQKQEPAAAGAAATASLGALAFLYPLKSPQNSKYKLFSAGKIMLFLEHKTNHS